MAGPTLDLELREREDQTFLSKAAAPYAKAIVERVVSNRTPCVLVLPTGAGKSTVVPYAFIRAGYRVMIAEPTVAMCSNIVESFKEMFPSVRVGQVFGRNEDKIPHDARLVVISNGSLKKKLLGAVKTGGVCTSVEFTDILILDEVHMGHIDAHIIVSIWYYCSTKFSDTARMPRLLLSSATVDSTLFSRRFTPCVTLPSEALTQTPYDIIIQWSEVDYSLTSNERWKAMGSLLRSIHQSRPKEERILVFLPGRQEMTKTQMASGLTPGVDIDLVTIWSESNPDDYKPIARTEDPLRLVVFATPSADAGLTIVGLKHVIDSLLVKQLHMQANGSTALVTEVASRQLMKQRRGRVGRTSVGTYYPMCTENFSKSEAMPDTYTLEINRLPLYKDIIELVSHGIQVEEVFAIYNIPSLESNIEQLLNWGLLRRSGISKQLFSSSGGSFLTQTDLAAPRLGGVLYAWVRMGYSVTEGVILVHIIAEFTSKMLHIPNFDVETRGKAEKMKTDFIRKHYSKFTGPSDVHTAIRIWNAMIASTGQQIDMVAVEKWCVANALQWRVVKNTLKSVRKTIPRISREAIRMGGGDTVESDNWTINESQVLPILRRLMEHVYQDQIAVRKVTDVGRTVYVSPDGNTMEPPRNSGFVVQSDPDSAVQFPAKVIIIGQSTSIASGKLMLTQYLDIDNPSTIAKISSGELNEKLGIFVSRGSTQFSSRVR